MAGRPKGLPKTGGRKKGVPNKVTGQLREMILLAAETAHPEGTLGYLREQATENPVAFMTLLGKVLPTTIGPADGASGFSLTIHAEPRS